MKKHLMYLFAALALGSSAHAQLKVGDNPTTIHSSAALEVQSTNKGFLPPRVALTSTTDVVTIPSPATGLLVVSTANASSGATAITGNTLYMWNGSVWSKVALSSDASVTYSDETVLVLRGASTEADYQVLTNGQNQRLAVQEVPINDGNWNVNDRSYTIPTSGLYQMTASYEIFSVFPGGAGLFVSTSASNFSQGYLTVAGGDAPYSVLGGFGGRVTSYYIAGQKIFPNLGVCQDCYWQVAGIDNVRANARYTFRNIVFTIQKVR